MQSLTLQVQFFPSRREQTLLRQLGNEYIRVVNALAEQALAKGSFPNITTRDVDAFLPSAVLNQAIRDAKSVYRKAKKLGKRPILRKRVYYVNNQNYTIGEESVAFPIMVNGKTKKTAFPAKWTQRHREMLANAKAKLAGINAVFVDPAYTSQTCPKCGTQNKAQDRRYICHSCGYTTHRDRVGAINIMQAVADGVAD